MPGSAPGTADVSFTPAGRRGTFAAGTTVLEAARALGVDLDSVCGARGICGRCQVEVGARPGVQADPARLSAPSTTELGYTGRRPFPDGRRLGCAAQILDDVVIDVPESSQVHRQVVRKDAGRLEVPVDPVLALHYVEVDEPTMVDAIGDLQRLRAALAKEWQLTGLEVDHSVLIDLQPALERGKRGVTVAVRSGREVVAVWPGLRDRVYGVAFDVGSTTLAGHLCDLFSGEVLASAGRMNPQISFGEDLMSRVSYVMMNPGGEVQLTAVVREALAAMVVELAAGGRTSSRPRCSRSAWWGTRSCITWSSGWTRDRSARRRSRWPPRSRSRCSPRRSASGCTRAPGSTRRPASPGTSGPTRRRWCSRRDRTAATR